MKHFIRQKGIWILAVAVSLAFMTAAASYLLGGTASPPANVWGTLSQPFQEGVSFLRGKVGEVTAYTANGEALLTENDRLRAQVGDLEKQVRELEADGRENTQLRQLLGLREKRQDLTFESARVIARAADNWSCALTLNRGAGCGLKAGDCGVDSSGALAGIVSETGDTWSTLLGVTDAGTELGGQVSRTGDLGLIEGDFSLMAEGLLKFTCLSEDTQLNVGDEIVTYGSEGKYPSGLLVGTVEEVRTDSSGMTHWGVVRPAVPPENLDQIFVITAFAEEQ